MIPDRYPMPDPVLGPCPCATCGRWLWWDRFIWREHAERGFRRHRCPGVRPVEATPLHTLTERWRAKLTG